MGRTKTEAPGGEFGKNDPGREYGEGQDVGHGLNHNCLQCRIARKALVDQHLIPAPKKIEAGTEAGTEAGDPVEDAPAISLPPVDPSTPNEEGISNVFDLPPRDEAIIGSPFTPDIGEDFAIDRTPPKIERPTIMGAVMEHLEDALAQTLTKALPSLAVNYRVEDVAADDGMALVDALRGVIPSLAVMVMQGYVPNDPRWHVELNNGVSRAHIKFLDRDVAIKLAVLTLFDGKAGADWERALSPYNQPDPISHFTGAMQANVRGVGG